MKAYYVNLAVLKAASHVAMPWRSRNSNVHKPWTPYRGYESCWTSGTEVWNSPREAPRWNCRQVWSSPDHKDLVGEVNECSQTGLYSRYRLGNNSWKFWIILFISITSRNNSGYYYKHMIFDERLESLKCMNPDTIRSPSVSLHLWWRLPRCTL